MTESVKVIVRCRPLVQKEQLLNCKRIVEMDKSTNQISLIKPDDTETAKTFRFDEIFDSNSE